MAGLIREYVLKKIRDEVLETGCGDIVSKYKLDHISHTWTKEQLWEALLEETSYSVKLSELIIDFVEEFKYYKLSNECDELDKYVLVLRQRGMELVPSSRDESYEEPENEDET